jgi:metallophosphoesterase (TIGR03767 family)
MHRMGGPGLNRRAFLARLGAAGALGWIGDAWTPARAAAWARSLAGAAAPGGTTLEASVVRLGAGPYHTLGDGPGYPTVVREDLAAAKDGRDDRRVALASIVHLTDVHLNDAQSPTRVEFTDRFGPPFESAYRAQETLTNQVATAMVQRINQIGAGPITGRPYDVCVSTGDNIDNQQHNELAWFTTTLDGGHLVPNSGDPAKYEGVQDTVAPDQHYWHPASSVSDDYKTLYSFPSYDGLLEAAIVGFDAPGLRVPWYSCYGNHDGLLQGNAPGDINGVKAFDALAVGMVKPINLAPGVSPSDLQAVFANPAQLAAILTNVAAPVRVVAADPTRTSLSIDDWINAHLATPSTPGPVGHGYTADMLGTTRLDYTFTLVPGVLGISIDTVNHGGYADGSIGTEQLAWLEARLIEASSRYLGPGDTEVRTGHADQLIVLFSHHNKGTMANPIPDPVNPLEQRHTADDLLALLRRFPNVVAWVNGHTHVNRVNPVPDPTGYTGGFWEVTTAAHCDYPEHARIVEVVDNRDGTLSIFGTVIEHAAPAAANGEDLPLLGLAAISRELSANDPQVNPVSKLGLPTDLNVELILTAPFDLNGATDTSTPAGADAAAGAQAGRGTLPATGTDLNGPLIVGGALAAGALALRRRVERDG